MKTRNNWRKEFDERFPKNYQVPWEQRLKNYRDAISRVLEILKSEGYLGGKTIKDYETIKTFSNSVSQELEKAREEVVAGLNGVPVQLIHQMTTDAREEGRQEHIYTNVKKAVQEEKTRILGIIEELRKDVDYKNNPDLKENSIWNLALEALKNKINAD